jgi:cytochrome bd ubiquinol oxidase subunit I
MELDTLLLSRLQFAANISFHILFPSISIALAWYLFFFRWRYLRTGQTVWLRAYRFWVKVFALTFALGVVSGITMSFQFGTNWPGYMERVGNIAGPLLGYEVLSAFFLEATFLGIMLFGMQRVSPRIHTLATFLVALGTSLSAFWIIALNSWMHTPAGFEMREGVAHPVNWLAIIFNPSMPYRLAHVMVASGLTAAFLMAGLSAYRLLKGDPKPAPRLTLKVAVLSACILAPVQILLGDLHGLNSLQHQPAKVAAIEGVWQTQTGAPLLLFALPDEAAGVNRFSLGVPGLASFILTHDWQGEIRGLNEFVGEHPPVAPVFLAFRVMVGIGLAMLLMAFGAASYYWRRQPLPRWLLGGFVAMSFAGWLATLAGWYVTEIGRQPWLVTGVLRTADAVTSLPPASVLTSLVAYLLVYLLLLAAYIRTLFNLANKALLLEDPQQTSNPIAEARP